MLADKQRAEQVVIVDLIIQLEGKVEVRLFLHQSARLHAEHAFDTVVVVMSDRLPPRNLQLSLKLTYFLVFHQLQPSFQIMP
jgi:hypothetical protein